MKSTLTVKGIRCSNQGTTLAEVLITIAFVAFSMVGILQTYIYVSTLSELSENTTSAVSQAQARVEAIRGTNYSQIGTNYDGVSFSVGNLNGRGVSYVDSTNADLLEVKVVVCWQNQNGRVIGEDTNLDGILDAGEDSNTNGELDSNVTLVTYIARR